MAKMNQYQAFKILRESGLLFEKKSRYEMTPEELADARAKSKARREARKARNAEPDNGDWAVCTFTPFRENFNRYKPEGAGDYVIQKILSGKDVLVGYYPSKSIAEKVAMTLFEKEMDILYKEAKKQHSSYGLENNTRKVLVVKRTPDDRRSSAGKRPGISGYYYVLDDDVSDKQNGIRVEMLERFLDEQEAQNKAFWEFDTRAKPTIHLRLRRA